MTAALAVQLSADEARSLTDQIKAHVAEINRLSGGLRAPRRERLRRHVYFIQAMGGGPIKIGSAADVTGRLQMLQTGSPVRLQVLAVIPGADECGEFALHAQFAESRLHGEWFQPTPELLDVIAIWQGRSA